MGPVPPCLRRTLYALSALMPAVLFLLAFLPAAVASPSGAQRATIIVGGDRDYPPYEFLDKEGQACRLQRGADPRHRRSDGDECGDPARPLGTDAPGPGGGQGRYPAGGGLSPGSLEGARFFSAPCHRLPVDLDPQGLTAHPLGGGPAGKGSHRHARQRHARLHAEARHRLPASSHRHPRRRPEASRLGQGGLRPGRQAPGGVPGEGAGPHQHRSRRPTHRRAALRLRGEKRQHGPAGPLQRGAGHSQEDRPLSGTSTANGSACSSRGRSPGTGSCATGRWSSCPCSSFWEARWSGPGPCRRRWRCAPRPWSGRLPSAEEPWRPCASTSDSSSRPTRWPPSASSSPGSPTRSTIPHGLLLLNLPLLQKAWEDAVPLLDAHHRLQRGLPPRLAELLPDA